jgi:2-dehydropantoate 2-reductase
MRFIVVGAGAVGGVVGGRLAEHGHDVLLLARGAHGEAMRERGLRVESPDGAITQRVAVAEHPAAVEWRDDDVVLLAVKSHDTLSALVALATVMPTELPVFCMQNGVASERAALRRFANVYGVCVMCPTVYLTPGVVQAWSSPVTGILDLGRYPTGTDAVADRIAASLGSATFHSQPRADIMRWKHGKLLTNLGNAVEAIGGPAARQWPIAALARAEGEACLAAARIDHVSEEEDAARRDGVLRLGSIAGGKRPGGSSWQSLARRAHGIETDYLNGEIVMLGRLHGVATPVNELLQRVSNRLAREARPPASMSESELLALLPPAVRSAAEAMRR